MGFQELPYSQMGRYSANQLLTNLPNTTIKFGQSISITALSDYFTTDQASNPVFTTGDLPSGAVFSPVTRKLSWTPTAAQAGGKVYSITINAEDDYLSATRTFSVTVNDADRSTGLPGDATVVDDSKDATNDTGGDTGGTGDTGTGGGTGGTGGTTGGGSGTGGSTGSGSTGDSSTGGGTVNPDPGVSNDNVLPPVKKKTSTTTKTSTLSGPVEAVKTAVVASVATINAAVQEIILDPISGRGTAKTTGLLIGILLVVVLPLVAAITIVILRRRARM